MVEYLYNDFFGFHSGYILVCCLRIIIALVLGILLGIERRNHFGVAGTRTMLLIAGSACLIGILSEFATHQNGGVVGDPTRIAAGAITGIGFVGGGAIMHQGLNVKGVTTATIIWACVALGLAVGYGLYIPSIVLFVLFLILLPMLEKIESKYMPVGRLKEIVLIFENEKTDFSIIRETLSKANVTIRDINFSDSIEDGKICIKMVVSVLKETDLYELVEPLKQAGKLVQFSVGQ